MLINVKIKSLFFVKFYTIGFELWFVIIVYVQTDERNIFTLDPYYYYCKIGLSWFEKQ